MPVFETAVEVACSAERAFEFLVRPANLLQVSPPEFHLKLLEAPERLHLGARITIQGSKFGLPQKITSEVTAFDEGVAFTDTQVSGPFAAFEHRHRVEPQDSGSRILDRIEYEAPGGLVGLFVTNAKIREYLEMLSAYRAERFRELLR
jgi:ligand-binding SRPBCC domain-containing protein